jgi:hypothetical protein
LTVIHDCLFGQETHGWLPGAFELYAKMVVRERATDYKLVEVLDEVFDTHHENSVILVPLVRIAAAFYHFLILSVTTSLLEDV